MLCTNPLGETNSSGLKGTPGKFVCDLSVIVQFQIYNIQVKTIVLAQLSYPGVNLVFVVIIIIIYLHMHLHVG